MYASNTAWDADFRDHYKHCAYSELSGSKDNHVYDDKEIMVPDLSHLTDEVRKCSYNGVFTNTLIIICICV